MVSFHSKSLIHTAPSQGERVYDDPAFKYMLLEHLPNLLNNDNLISIPIDQQLADMFYGDYYGVSGKESPHKWVIEKLLYARKLFAYGEQVNYFDDPRELPFLFVEFM